MFCLCCLLCSMSLTLISLGFSWHRHPSSMGALPDTLHEMTAPHMDVHAWSTAHYPDVLLILQLPPSIWLIMSHHQRRYIMYRLMLIYTTLMCMRSVLLFTTTLPDPSPLCVGRTPGGVLVQHLPLRSIEERSMQVACGDSLTCGDMMFSGHTVLLVMVAMLWHTYYPRITRGTINYVKLLSWILNLLGLFLVIITRMHYTMDVIVAAHFTITLWVQYHRTMLHIRRYNQAPESVWIVDEYIIYPLIMWIEH